jgi:putative flippase GtrA
MANSSIELAKFTLIGAVNFAFTFVIFYILITTFNVSPSLALIVASLFGMIFTYHLNRKLVFNSQEKSEFKRGLARYVIAGSVSVGLNALALEYIIKKFGWNPFLIQLSIIPFIIAFNFSTAKFWSLRP